MKTIGIVGGMGPLAGVDLHSKIIQFTQASRDQEHLSIIHIALPSEIADRSCYLLEPKNYPNPGNKVYEVIEQLYRNGAQLIGIPCNTCHAQPIFSLIQAKIQKNQGSKIHLLHMIHEVRKAVQGFGKIGLLATWGTYSSRLYWDIFQEQGLRILHPASKARCLQVHRAIYDSKFGVKANPGLYDNEFARAILLKEAQALVANGARAIIMGCTEISLVLRQSDIDALLLDATAVLAQALVGCATGKRQP